MTQTMPEVKMETYHQFDYPLDFKVRILAAFPRHHHLWLWLKWGNVERVRDILKGGPTVLGLSQEDIREREELKKLHEELLDGADTERTGPVQSS